ncbi:MAG: PP2C family protein-serine/threonine phosphatase [Janthinobacterium lividum]
MNTEKTNAEMLMDSDERLRLLEDNVRDFAIIELASDGRIAHWNLGAERILGYQEAEIVGQNIAVIFTPEDRAQGVVAQELKGAVATGRADDERWHVKKDGTKFWASGIMTGLRDPAGNLRGFAKILRDRTESKQLAEELAAASRRERRTAEVLQRSILMGNLAQPLTGLEVSTQYESASDDLLVGGDFFDAFALPKGKSALVLGDVMGKGLAAAAQTAQVKFALRVFLREGADPAQALERLNSFLCQSERLDNPGRSAEFVVLCIAVFDAASGSLSVCGAGMEPPLVMRVTGELEQVKTGGQPLGVFDGAQYTSEELHLEQGDIILLTTDGITEAKQNGTFLGYEGMVHLAQQSLALGSMDLVGKAILEGARAFAGGSFRDDVCLLLARRQEVSI